MKQEAVPPETQGLVQSTPKMVGNGLLDSDYTPIRGLNASSGTLSSGSGESEFATAVEHDISQGLYCSADKMINFLLALCCTNQAAKEYAFDNSGLASACEEVQKFAIEKDTPFDDQLVKL